MDPRTGLDWMYEGASVGQFQARRLRLQRSPLQVLADAWAVQVYELRPDPGIFRSLYRGRERWMIRQNSPFSSAGLARSLYYSLCNNRGTRRRYRTIVKLFERRTGVWTLVTECDLPRT